MVTTKMSASDSSTNWTAGSSTHRTFMQFLYESIWACGCGALAAHWPP